MGSGEGFGKDVGEWKWVLGMYMNKSNVRFVHVQDSKASTLLSVIKEYVESGSYIWTDEWTSYKVLQKHAYIHKSVNHNEHYVDPSTGAHTQGMKELGWTVKPGINHPVVIELSFKAISTRPPGENFVRKIIQ